MMRQIRSHKADGADHRKLRQRPDHAKDKQHPSRRHLVGDEADTDGGNGKEEIEG